jgi:hypothetical protein
MQVVKTLPLSHTPSPFLDFSYFSVEVSYFCLKGGLVQLVLLSIPMAPV